MSNEKSYDIAVKRHLSGGVEMDCGSLCEEMTLDEACAKIRAFAEESGDELCEWLKDASAEDIGVGVPHRIGDKDYTIVEWPKD